jgi:hypothetical protein
VNALEASISGLRADREELVARTRDLVQRLGGALQEHDVQASGQHVAGLDSYRHRS